MDSLTPIEIWSQTHSVWCFWWYISPQIYSKVESYHRKDIQYVFKNYSRSFRSYVAHCQDGNVQVVSLLFSALLTPSLDCLSVFSAQALAAVKFDGASFWTLHRDPHEEKKRYFSLRPLPEHYNSLDRPFKTAREEPWWDDLENQWRVVRVTSTWVWPSDKGEARNHSPQGGSTSDPSITFHHSLHLQYLRFSSVGALWTYQKNMAVIQLHLKQ